MTLPLAPRSSVLAAALLILTLPRTPIAAQSDTSAVLRTVARAREALRDLPVIWRLDGDSIDWLFVNRTEAFLTVRRGGSESLQAVTLPAGAQRANMAYDLDGRRVAMVMLPLGRDVDLSASLLVHEAMHTFQPDRLPHPGATEPQEGGDYLDGPTGRTWFFLELRALARAVLATGDARRTAARDALLFRARRDSLAHASERKRLDALDLAEGIPEYTGWRLTRRDPAALAARLDSSEVRTVSWVRAAGYATGPAYGYLLDALAGDDWRPAWQGGARLPEILAAVLGSTPITDDLDARARLYGGDGIRRREIARDTERRRRLDSLRTRFVTRAQLRILPPSLRVTFDPNGQTPLGDAGTVMLSFRWAASDGAELVAPEGALVAPDWSWFQVPLGAAAIAPGTLAEPLVLEGDGWRLTLPAGWRVTRVGTRLEVRPPA